MAINPGSPSTNVSAVPAISPLARQLEDKPKQEYKSRDFDKEARGKTLCALYEAGLSSPWLAQIQDEKEYLATMDRVVQHCFDEVFKDR